MGINKIIYGGNTLIDLTNDTVTADTLAKGVVAHAATGEQIVGTMSGGGGEDVLLFETEIAVKTSSASAQDVIEIDISDKVDFSKTYVFHIEILDLNGKRNGYYYGTITNAMFYLANSGGFSRRITVQKDGSEKNTIQPIQGEVYGIFLNTVTYNPSKNIAKFVFRKRYNDSYTLKVDGNFSIKIYAREITSI